MTLLERVFSRVPLTFLVVFAFLPPFNLERAGEQKLNYTVTTLVHKLILHGALLLK